MDILSRLHKSAGADGQRAAVVGRNRTLTYSQLDEYSDRLAVWLHGLARAARPPRPVAVYGHKDPFMIVCFLAAAKSGRAYCPLDISIPESRIKDTITALEPEVIFNLGKSPDIFEQTAQNTDSHTENAQSEIQDRRIVTIEEIMQITGYRNAADTKTQPSVTYDPAWAVSGDDTFYIIFTSGSTGKPKGVKISANCLNNYLSWSANLGSSMEEKSGKTFLNQAPFSFDLSVMDMYTCLTCGGTLALMEKQIQNDYSMMVEFFRKTPLNIWVSTPSFADMCMAEPLFNSSLLPELSIFLFCGEELTPGTYSRLRERFPESRIINTYGPTESTVAVTGIEITDDIYRNAVSGIGKLPAGIPREGTIIKIESAEESLDIGENLGGAGEAASDVIRGEIIIIGDTVSTGYFNNPQKTAEVFFETETAIGKSGGAVKTRGYRTGDVGCIIDGQLYCLGRIDFQIKLHGYRIELGDIEQNLTELPEIRQAVVLPVEKDGRIKSLTAYVVLNTSGSETAEASDADTGSKSERRFSKYIKDQLRLRLPEYMIPKKIVVLDYIPVNSNGKTDRKQLRSIIS